VSVTTTVFAGAAVVSVVTTFHWNGVPTVAAVPPGVVLASWSTGKTGETATDPLTGPYVTYRPGVAVAVATGTP
jgi:hypothetical protein